MRSCCGDCRRGKGQTLSAGERAAAPGRLLVCDADLSGDLRPLLESRAEVAVAAFAERQGGGFGLAKRTGRALIRLRSGFEAREPLSGSERSPREPAPRASRSRPGSAARCG